MAAPTSRLDQWKKPIRLKLGVSGDDESKIERYNQLKAEFLETSPRSSDDEDEKLTLNSLIRMSRELIFSKKENKYIFHAISYYIDVNTLDVMVGELFEISSSPDPDETEDDEHKNILAIAAMEEVPVYPNTPDLVPVLADFHRRMLVDGFTAPDGKGGRVNLRFAKRPTVEFTKPNLLRSLDLTGPIFPAEVEIIRGVLFEELSRLGRAEQVLTSIDIAIDQLSELMESNGRVENDLQRCITNNPILFGTEYTRIIPKHRLGAEYEMDYAGERLNGMFDLIELESSSLPLYTKGGNPSSYLVHAEQQILDWMCWIEKNNSYARSGLPGISSPVGYIVLGRRSELSEAILEKLRIRNSYWRGKMEILTYDDLLDRAKNLKKHLEALRRE